MDQSPNELSRPTFLSPEQFYSLDSVQKFDIIEQGLTPRQLSQCLNLYQASHEERPNFRGVLNSFEGQVRKAGAVRLSAIPQDLIDGLTNLLNEQEIAAGDYPDLMIQIMSQLQNTLQRQPGFEPSSPRRISTNLLLDPTLNGSFPNPDNYANRIALAIIRNKFQEHLFLTKSNYDEFIARPEALSIDALQVLAAERPEIFSSLVINGDLTLTELGRVVNPYKGFSPEHYLFSYTLRNTLDYKIFGDHTDEELVRQALQSAGYNSPEQIKIVIAHSLIQFYNQTRIIFSYAQDSHADLNDSPIRDIRDQLYRSVNAAFRDNGEARSRNDFALYWLHEAQILESILKTDFPSDPNSTPAELEGRVAAMESIRSIILPEMKALEPSVTTLLQNEPTPTSALMSEPEAAPDELQSHQTIEPAPVVAAPEATSSPQRRDEHDRENMQRIVGIISHGNLSDDLYVAELLDLMSSANKDPYGPSAFKIEMLHASPLEPRPITIASIDALRNAIVNSNEAFANLPEHVKNSYHELQQRLVEEHDPRQLRKLLEVGFGGSGNYTIRDAANHVLAVRGHEGWRYKKDALSSVDQDVLLRERATSFVLNLLIQCSGHTGSHIPQLPDWIAKCANDYVSAQRVLITQMKPANN